MMNKKKGIALLVASMAFGASAAQAESFSTMGTISATPLSATQMKAVEGKAHVYRLVESLGVEVSAKVELVLRGAAAPNKNFAPSPSASAPAFPPPPAPTL